MLCTFSAALCWPRRDVVLSASPSALEEAVVATTSTAPVSFCPANAFRFRYVNYREMKFDWLILMELLEPVADPILAE